MVLIQAMGVRALGLDYFSKFFNLKTIVTKPFFGLMDFIVSLLEMISEIAKVLSFSLRLFGNIFAGGLLLAILGSMTVFFVPGLLVGLALQLGAYLACTVGPLRRFFPGDERPSALELQLFILGCLTLFVALVSPVDTLASYSLSMHMVQHILLKASRDQQILIAIQIHIEEDGAPRPIAGRDP